jgi:pimeloyl-ACP methyl ester carboxylesterase
MGKTATVLLVHGAWHGPWCWERVEAELAARGIAVRTVSLPSCGADPLALGGLNEDAATVAAAAAAIGGDVVVCGHSYGGMVITEASFAENVCRLVYLCAFMPVEGASLVSHFPALPPFAEMRADGSVAFVEGFAGPVLYSDCTRDDVRLAASRLVLHSAAAITTPVTHCSWRTIPSTYVVCSEDRTIPPDMQRVVAANATTVRTLAASHMPMWSKPQAVADILAEEAAVARATALA